MTKYEIINDLAQRHVVEKMVKGCLKGRYDQDANDLVQDIYLSIMEKNDSLVEEMFQRGELEYFILGMVKNNIFSTHSPFYYKYKLWNQKRETFECNEDKDIQEDS